MVWFSKLAHAAAALSTPHAPEDFLSLLNPIHSSRQLRGVVTKVVRETEDSVTIAFRPGRGWHAHQAGQWARIGVEINGVRQWRSYSLSNAAGHGPAITVKDLGAVSGALVRGTKPGDVLFLTPPEGDFILPEHPRPLLMLTAGSGITPVMSMIRTLIPHRQDADVVLITSNSTPETSLFREELDEMADQFPTLRIEHWFTGAQGRLPFTLEALARLCPDWRDRAAYACGPEGFLNDAQALWNRESIPGSGPGLTPDTGAEPPEDTDAETRSGTLTLERFTTGFLSDTGHDGGLVTFEQSDRQVQADGDTPLLDIGEDAGILMPSGCRMGICHSCLVPLRSGQVRDLRTGELHYEAGQLIQTCVSAAAGPVNLDL